MRQQCVLLSFVPAVHFVDEKNGALAVQLAALAGFMDHPAQFGYASQHRRDGFKMRQGAVGDHLRQRGFASARRAGKDDG